MISRRFTSTIASFNNTTQVSESYDLTPFLGASFAVVVTGAGGAGTMKLQVSNDPGISTSWMDLPATLGGASATQTITVGTTPHYLNTGNIAFYSAV